MDAPLASDLIIAEFLWENIAEVEPLPSPPRVPMFAMETRRPPALAHKEPS